MIRLGPLFLLTAFASAQSTQQLIARGGQVFQQTCVNGYCHVSNGADGGAAPRLVARGFDESYIANVVRSGIPGTAMAAFGNQLPASDLAAVIAYVDSLNGVTPSANPAGQGALEPAVRIQRSALSPEAEKGRSLFFEATLGFGRCSTCHEVGNFGLPVASPIQMIPASVAALKALKTPRISTATVGGESMPVLVLSQGSKAAILYDLTSAPPVYRVLDPSQVMVAKGSSWSHASVMRAYDDAELGSILAFLRAAVGP